MEITKLNQATTDVGGLPALATKKETAKWAGCTERNIELLVHSNRFPAPIRLGTRPRWRRSDLLQWLESQAADAKGGTHV